jgi:hypothetical protein
VVLALVLGCVWGGVGVISPHLSFERRQANPSKTRSKENLDYYKRSAVQ